jgi:hypothetical protein
MDDIKTEMVNQAEIIKLYLAAESGDLGELKNFFNNVKDPHHKISISTLCEASIREGNFEITNYLLNELNHNDDLFDDTNIIIFLKTAVNNNHLNVVDLIMKNPRIIQNDFLGHIVTEAAKTGKPEIIEYLFNNFPDNQKLYRYLKDGDIIGYAADNGHMNVLEYIFNHQNLKNHVNIHVQNDRTIRAAYKNNHFDVVNYLVFDFKMGITPFLEEYMKNEPEL